MVFAVSECNSIETFESKHKQESFSALSSVTRWIDFFFKFGHFYNENLPIIIKIEPKKVQN